MEMIARLRYILLVVALVGCAPTPQSPLGDDETSSQGARYLSVAALKSLYIDNAHSLTDLLFVSGTITANDYMGEYPNTLIIEDDTGALAVSVDLEEQIANYPIGREVTIFCTDLWLGSDGGALMLGCESTGDYIVEPLEADDFVARATVDSESEVVARAPQVVTISEFSSDLLSCYLMLDGVTLLPNEEGVDTYCALDPDTGRRVSTTHTLQELATGDEVSLYIPSTAYYANEKLPSGSGSVCVTLERYGSSYSVRLLSQRIYFDDLE